VEINYLGQICDTTLAVAELGLKWFLPFLEHEGLFSVSKTEQNKVTATGVLLAVLQGSVLSIEKVPDDEMYISGKRCETVHISLFTVMTKEGTSPGWKIST
jgi:hypothetical protein